MDKKPSDALLELVEIIETRSSEALDTILDVRRSHQQTLSRSKDLHQRCKEMIQFQVSNMLDASYHKFMYLQEHERAVLEQIERPLRVFERLPEVARSLGCEISAVSTRHQTQARAVRPPDMEFFRMLGEVDSSIKFLTENVSGMQLSTAHVHVKSRSGTTRRVKTICWTTAKYSIALCSCSRSTLSVFCAPLRHGWSMT